MISIIAMHRQPTDAEVFDSYYWQHHMPLVRQIPGVAYIRVGHSMDSAVDGHGFYLVCETAFENETSWRLAVESVEMAAALADVPNFSTGGVQIVTTELSSDAELPLRGLA